MLGERTSLQVCNRMTHMETPKRGNGGAVEADPLASRGGGWECPRGCLQPSWLRLSRTPLTPQSPRGPQASKAPPEERSIGGNSWHSVLWISWISWMLISANLASYTLWAHGNRRGHPGNPQARGMSDKAETIHVGAVQPQQLGAEEWRERERQWALAAGGPDGRRRGAGGGAGADVSVGA